MTVTVFPHSFVRYAPLCPTLFEALALPEQQQQQLDTLHALEAEKEHNKTILCEELYYRIQDADNDAERKKLLNIKRAVYNDKLTADIPAGYAKLLTALQDGYAAWETSFEQQLTVYRKQLQRWAEGDLLKKGLLLSSPTLYSQLPSFINRAPSVFRHKEQKNEYSLLRYLTRMSFKTSPFSTFTYTGTAVMGDGYYLPADTEIISNIRLNNKLFDYLRLLMVHHPVLSEILEVQLNPTVVQENAHVHFLAAYRNIEAFQKMPCGSVVQWLYSYLPQQPGPVNIRMLADILSSQIPDTDRQQIKAYLLQLISSGYLEAGTGCSGVNPAWDSELYSFLERRLPGHPLTALLLLLRQQREAYAGATTVKRDAILREAGHFLQQHLNMLEQEAGVTGVHADNGTLAQLVQQEVKRQKEKFDTTHFMLQQFPLSGIFYEDASTKAKGMLPVTDTTALVNKAELLCTLLEQLDSMQEERIRMRDFFLKHYGETGNASITSFYKTYYQQEKKQQKEQRKRDVVVFPSHILEAKDITAEEIRLSAAQFNMAPGQDPCARGMFVQLFRNGSGELCGVINHMLPGMGKVAGRFLDLFDPVITQDFNEWNRRLHPEVMQAELGDGSSFNANIHPPLLPYGIRIPGGHSNYSDHQLIAMDKIEVRFNPATRLLFLVHTPDNKEIHAYDLSLQSFFNRSNFYQLLAHFNPERRIPLRALIMEADAQYQSVFPADKEQDIVSKPRITFEQHIILRRKAWIVRTSAIPQPGNTETDAGYYARLSAWRARAELPEHVFLFLKSYAIPAGADEKVKMIKDDYKPQYICFSKPLLVILFRKLLSKAGKYIYLEEMLPHVSEIEQVTEHLIHWYKYMSPEK
ncbi:lantibiotic dehydratase [Chitinophaga tropicalis]|uniref:Lantibiotic dehydratase N-terminal domain-containing protein n=1 Tax=Chitinophaga tropicalis TaxID=2683588 RepID=A0A7K1U8A0_9BACT|nr:lantibiotic dehydratase [Chitinophaga tropicalis]MVT10603.1 hypothetical protein [Chitinophaga tropicalis]